MSESKKPAVRTGKDIFNLVRSKQNEGQVNVIPEPAGEVQIALMTIWKGILPGAGFTTSDDFFKVGGNSIKAVQLASQASRHFNISVELTDIFLNPTITGQEIFISEKNHQSTIVAAISVQSRNGNIPLSYNQQWLWFADKFEDSVEYHLAEVLQLKGKINYEALHFAFNRLITRHEVLRTIYTEYEGVPFQKVMGPDEFKIDQENGFLYQADEERLNEFIDGEIGKPFDLSKDYPIRALLIAKGNFEHLLVINMHHIASDGWSMSIIVKEAIENYNGFISGKLDNKEPLKIQYADYAIWQRDFLQTKSLKDKLEFWTKKLEGVTAIDLPADFSRPAVKTKKGAVKHFLIDNDLTDQVRKLGNQEGSTLFMTLMAAFNVLLHKYSGQNDLCVGTPMANRLQNQTENLVGFFTNTIAFRSRVDPRQSFSAFLTSIKQTALQAYSHQEVPFEKVVEAVVKDRDISRSPLFDVVFILQNTPDIEEIKLIDAEVKHTTHHSYQVKYDLTFTVTEMPDGLDFLVEYRSDLYTSGRIDKMMDHFIHLLKCIVNAPQELISKYKIVTPAEEDQILHEFNSPSAFTPQNVVEVFEQQVENAPGNIALTFNNLSYSYAELNQKANRLARFLRAKGVTTETLVPICLERSTEIIVAILGILKAGAAYVPIDPAYPVDRIQYMLDDIKATVVLVSLETVDAIPHLPAIDVLDISSSHSEIDEFSPENPKVDIKPDNLAYIIYTSGSTGKPKGVMLEHKGVVNLAKSQADNLRLKPGLKTLQFASYGFDASCYEIFNTLLSGGQLVIPKKEDLLSASQFESFINLHKVDVAVLPPSFLQVMKNNIGTISTIVSAGEPINPDTCKFLQSRDIRMINAYGPTENTVCTTLTDNPVLENDIITIGKPIANVQVRIVDKNNDLCSIGINGEMCIAGAQVARGYFNRPDLSKEKFVKDWFNKDEDQLMYRTGDIGRWLPDGSIEFIGRMDDQVKIRGYRIELGEIENVLQQCEGVELCTVIAGEDKLGDLQLVTYIESDGVLTRQQVTEYLQTSLPEFMVPGIIVFLPKMPLTISGKIDKKSLPDPSSVELTDTEFQAPQNPLQQKLSEIWMELLEIDRLGINDNFFELGGHSMLAMRMGAAIRRQLNADLPVKAIFQHPTIASLSKIIEQFKELAPLPAIIPGDRPGRIPLSFSQARLWFIHQLHGTNPYHIPAVLRLNGKLNIDALNQALQSVVDRHHALRTIVLEDEGRPYQVIQSSKKWKLMLVNDPDLSDEGKLKDYIHQQVTRVFDLSKDYMLRARLVELNSEEHILILTVHHIAADGWSMPVIVKEIVALYQHFAYGAVASLPVLKVQYADYAIWQNQFLTGEVLENRLAYWTKVLEDVPPLQLPLDYKRPPVQSTNGAVTEMVFPVEVLNGLKLLGKQQYATLFMTLLSAFKVLLYRYSGQQDICVGTSVANRQHEETEGVVGFFVNNIALRSQVIGNESFVDLLSNVNTSVLDAFQYQDVPFEKVVDAVVHEREMSRNPIFQVLFVLQNTPEIPAITLPGLQMSPLDLEHTTAQLDMIFNVKESAEGLHLSVEYCTDLFAVETIQRMIANFGVLLHSVTKNPSSKIDQLELFTEVETNKLLSEFNNTNAALGIENTVVDLFNAQVSRVPNNIALIYADESITFSELNERSNQLAGYIVSKGILVGDIVPVCMHRGFDMLVAIWAILKAGAAYAPIDPEYPAERIQFIAGDTKAKLIICNEDSILNLDLLQAVEQVNLDRLQNTLSGFPTHFTTMAKPGQLAYIIYTSGSTGTPKGVAIQHCSLSNYLLNGSTNYVNRSSGGTGSFLSLSFTFDASITSLFMPSIAGKTLVLSANTGVKVFDDENFLAHAPFDFLKITPAHLELLKAVDDSYLTNWFTRKLVIGGEALLPGHIDHFIKEDINVQVINEYGPTEAAVGCSTYSFFTVTDKDMIKNSISIGKPIDNVKLSILGPSGTLMPIGAAGEICIAGQGLSSGYLNQPELTSEKFIADPFGKSAKSKIYKTGDYGRWLPDGNIEYIGRIDDQVKVRGYRVELSEIENVLLKSGLVKQAAVIVKQDKENNKRLAAYVVCDDTEELEQVKEYSIRVLPEHMLPSFWIAVNSMPLTISGKIDKKALPEPVDNSQPEKEIEDAPLSELNNKLADIWKDLLELDEIGINDNFFNLGGDSLLAVRVVAAIRKKLQAGLEINAIFDHPTIAGLSSVIEGDKNDFLLPPIVPADRPKNIPLSFSQERLWVIHQLEGSVQYHLNTVLSIDGEPELAALNDALHQIVSRHEILRTVYRQQDGKPYQVIMSAGDITLKSIDRSFNNISDAELNQLILEETSQPFDLATDYMIRASLVKINMARFVLIVTLHHIASDGWSNNIFIKEVTECYNSFKQKKKASLPALPIQYADFAIWQRANLQGDLMGQKIAFWKTYLQNVEPLQLPADYQRPAMQSFRGAVIPFSISSQIKEKLQNISKQHDATLFMTLLSAFYILLKEYSGQQDITVGTPVANRKQQEVESLIGFFVNTLVLRTRVDNDLSFTSLLLQVKGDTLKAFEHQDLPFEKVVDAVVSERDMSRNPLFQVMFVYQEDVRQNKHVLNDLSVAVVQPQQDTSKFDLSFFINESDGDLECFVEYCTDLYSHDTVVRMISHFTNLLQNIALKSDQRIGSLSLLSPNEQHQLLHEFQGRHMALKQESMVSLFEQQVALSLDKPAIVSGERSITYNELNALSNRIGRYLQSLGVKAGSFVPVNMERSIEMVVALLGVLKAGAAYVPIDKTYPLQRVAYMIKDCGASIALCNSSTSSQLIDISGITVVEIDNNAAIGLQKSDNTRQAISQNDLAYVMYTSGSTGQPKGVMIEHRSVSDFLQWCHQEFGQSDVETVYGGTSINFDLSVFEIFYSLTSGKTLRLLQNGLEAARYLPGDQKVLLNSVPSVIESLLKENTDLRNVTVLNMAGEPVSAFIQQHLDQENIEVRNLYGPTEDTTYSTVYRMRKGQPLLIGKPIANSYIRIVNPQLQLLPVGITGEICIGGAGLARGYLNRHDLTNEKFINDPFSSEADALLYKTGDVGRWLPDGNIEYLGRIDDQVKIRGYRIELGEIENVLQQNETISQAAAVAITDNNGSKRLAAYVVPGPGFNKEKLELWLAQRLPDYMVPHLWMQLERLPLNQNGKIDRKALPAIEPAESSPKRYTAPTTQTEIQLAAIWGELLGKEQVGVDDNFFGLGGDSILTIQAVSRANRLAYHLHPRDIFKHQTIRRLSKALADNHAKAITGEQGQLQGIAGLLPIQHNFLESDQPEPSHYNQSVLLNINKNVSKHMLRQVVRLLVQQHDALRFRYFKNDGIWQQEYGQAPGELFIEDLRSSGDVPAALDQIANQYQQSLNIEKGGLVRMVWIQMPGEVNSEERIVNNEERIMNSEERIVNNEERIMNSEERIVNSEERIVNNEERALVNEESSSLIPQPNSFSNRQLTTDNSPLTTHHSPLTTHNSLTAHQKNRLLIIIHHLAVDGVSWRLLLEDLEVLLTAAASGQQAILPTKTSSYRQWYQALEQYGQSSSLLKQKEYWHQAASRQSLQITDTKYEGPILVKDLGNYKTSLDAGETSLLLQQVPKVYHTGINDLLLAALARAFQQLLKTNTLLIGLEGQGREDISAVIDTSHTVGWFTSLYPVLLNIENCINHDQLIKAVKEQLRAVPDKGLSYGVLKYINHDKALKGKEQYDLIFNYLGQLDNVTGNSKWFSVARENSGENRSGETEVFEKISLAAQVLEGQLELHWSYSTKHFNAQTIQNLAGVFVGHLAAIISHCQKQEEIAGAVYTPSDYGIEKEVSYPELDAFLQTGVNGQPISRQIESIYRLSGLQQGMLFHSLYHPGGAYIEQFTCSLPAEVNLEAFEKSWQAVIERHTILRSSFWFDALSIPVQAVMKQAVLQITQIDLRQKSIEEQAAAIFTFESEDRTRGFDFKQAPLMRLVLLHTTNGYRLVWTYHHLLIDGWSMPVLFQEFLKAYDQLSAGQQLPAQPIDHYEDYIRYIEGINKDEEESYWKNYLKGVDGPTLLPFISALAGRNKAGGIFETIQWNADEALQTAVHHFAQKNRITVNTIMQGIWAYLLSQYTGKPNVVFGIIVSGRPNDLPEVEQRAGLYINTLPLAAHIENADTIADWLQRMQQEQINSLAYQYTPLANLQAWAKIPGDFFDSILIFENYPVSKLLTDTHWGLKVTDARMNEQTNYPLTIAIHDSGQLQFSFSYNTQLLAEQYVHNIQAHFKRVLAQVVQNEATAIADLQLLSKTEEEKLLGSYNPTSAYYPNDKTITALFEEQAARTPENVAVVFEGKHYTYEQINKRANQVAHCLKNKGVTAETLVPICLERSVEMIVGLLGIMKAGGAYVPIDLDYPLDRIRFILKDTAATLLVTSGEVADRLHSEVSIEVIKIDSDQPHIYNEPETNLPAIAGGNNLAYIIYTSGSTGIPKGVMIEHSCVVNLAMSQIREFGIDESEKILQFSSYAFDASVEQIIIALFTGAALILVDKETLTDTGRLIALIEREKVTHVHATPSFLETVTPAKYGHLKRVIAGGEQCPLVLAQSWGKLVTFYNEYGPTETSVTNIEHKYSPDNDLDTLAIGRPISNTPVYIVNTDGQLAPEGVVGEIWIGGSGVARGYLNRAELTEEKFIANPFDKQENARVYKTGDYGRWSANGYLEYYGRIDEQVKIRGYRIEPGEIEKVLQQSGLVKQAVVVVSESSTGNKQLVAYVVAGEKAFEQKLAQDYLFGRLPAYMVPQVWIEIEKIPLSANGKVDKSALPSADDLMADSNLKVLPRNATEATLATIWQNILGTDQPSVLSNFFELGGHSLLAMRLLSAIRRQFNAELGIKEIFTHPTIAQMAELLKTVSAGSDVTPIVQVDPKPENIPLSFGQERLWFIDKLEGTTQYHIPVLLRLKGTLDRTLLQKAFEKIIERHHVLRTVLAENAGSPFQVVKEATDFDLQFADGAGYSTEETNKTILEAVNAPFNLYADQMLRAGIIQANENENLLWVVVHHIAADGWSMPILIKEVVTFYNAFINGQTFELSPLPVQYADYAIWQRNYFDTPALHRKLAYWKQQLEDVTALDLPADHSRPAMLSGKGDTYTFTVEQPMVDALNKISLQHNSTLYMLLLSAFKVLLFRYTGQGDICIGGTVANRTQPELENLAGFFVNTIALRDQLTADMLFSGLLQQVKNTLLQAYDNQEVPFEKVVEETVSVRDMSRSPLFQVMFALQNEERTAAPLLENLEISAENIPQNTAKFELTFNLAETGNGMYGTIEYSTDLYLRERMEAMTGHFLQILQSVVLDPGQSISDLTILTKDEEQQILTQFNETHDAFTGPSTFIEFFDRQLLARPNDVALVFGEDKITYGELNKRSALLADYLTSRGVAKETLVPVCLYRSADLVVAMVAILKAGGAYVPIDPHYPAERIEYMLRDTGAMLVISNKKAAGELPRNIDLEKILMDEVDLNIVTLPGNQTVSISPNQLAYVIYTSGSTGRPKGVMIEHASLANLIHWHIKEYWLTPQTISTAMAGVAFDAFGWEIFPYLAAGATIHILDDDGGLLPEKLVKIFNAEGITHSFISTALVPEFVERSKGNLAALQMLLTGGDKLPPVDISGLHYRLINNYGPTENTVVATRFVLQASNYQQTPLIGSPISNTSLFILDENDHLLPIGVPGQLCISGAQVARGYLHNATLTSQKFINNPYRSSLGDVLYKTGDKCRWTKDGNIEFLGRLDDQVKIRGYRIELGEIESCVLQSGLVQQTLVLVNDNGKNEKRLVAYIVAEKEVDTQLLIGYLQKFLPDYMIPRLWVPLEAFPLNSNGKIDRKALPDVEKAGTSETPFVAPESKTEIQLADLWQELLKVEKIGINDNYFEAGGHSLLAMRLIADIQKTFGMEIAVKEIFEFTTIRELARFLEVKMAAQKTDTINEFDEIVI